MIQVSRDYEINYCNESLKNLASNKSSFNIHTHTLRGILVVYIARALLRQEIELIVIIIVELALKMYRRPLEA